MSVSDRPKHVVFIMADQLRADHLGREGRYPVRTPNLDALAAHGTSFSQAFVANPVCMPNRSTILTGQWPSRHGLRTNGLPLDWEAETFPRILRGEGWRTAAVGKIHVQPMGWPFEEWQLDEIQETLPDLWKRAVERFGKDFVSWEDFHRHAQGEVQLPSDYYGFDDVALTVGHGDVMSGNYVAWARERGWNPMADAGRGTSSAVSEAWAQVYESAVPAALHPTTYVTDEAISRIRGIESDDRPLMLQVSFPDPHHPFAPPREYFDRHRPEEMTVPTTFGDSHHLSPDYIRRIVAQRGFPNEDPTMTWAPTEEQFRVALAAELGSVEFIDDSVGRIVAALGETGVLDETLIVFTADHGDVFGEHGLMLKHFTHYRPVVRVPLIFRGPGVDEQVCDELVSSADIAPTVLALLGAGTLTAAQGSALLHAGQPVSGRTTVLIEEDQPFGLEGLPGPVRMRTVITQRLRLTEIVDAGVTELYDLVADPEERINLASDPSAAELLASGRQAMLQEVVSLADASSVPFHAA